jgi:hypothetical protein
MFVKKGKWKILKTNLNMCRIKNLSPTFVFFFISRMQCSVLAGFTSVCTLPCVGTADLQANQEGFK